MCIAILVKAGTTVPLDHLREGARANPDGCGLGWVENNKVQMFKTMSFDTWLIKYLDVLERLGNIQMLIHFRITSKGDTTVEMCHPFQVDDNHILIHNGTISSIPKKSLVNGRSDTAVFAEELLRNLPVGWESNASILHILEEYVGYSKVLILDSNNNVTFLNEGLGHWRDDVWYSNKSYESITKSYSDNYYMGSAKHNRVGNTVQWDVECCDGCQNFFDYTKLTYENHFVYCDECLGKNNRYMLPAPEDTEALEAEALLQKADSERGSTILTEIVSCTICDEDFFDSDIYGVYVETTAIEVSGVQDVCASCFKQLYADPDVLSVEIIY